MAAVPACSIESRLTRPMVVGPFSPAMRSGSVADSGAAVSSSEAAAEEAASDTAVLETAELAAAGCKAQCKAERQQ